MTARGFSLVEALVALVVLGLVSALGLSALGLVGRAGAAVAPDPVEVVAAQELLRLRLLAAMPLVAERDGTQAVLFEGTAERLAFVAELPPRFALPGPALVELRREAADLVLRWAPLSAVASGEGAAGRVLLGGISGLALRYFGDPHGREGAAWRDSWHDAAVLPAAVEVAVAFPDGDRRHWPNLVVAPRRAVPAP